MKKRLVIGLTGGIGSGKSTVADEFARLGAAIVDTDAIAHELTGPKGPAIPQIKTLFGEKAIGPDGAMDRQRMREHVFADPEAKRQLEGLLHPMIREESARRIAAAFQEHEGAYVVHVVPCWSNPPTTGGASTGCWWSIAPRSSSSPACASAA
jgi:dephospho-CoA kinase